MSDPYPDIARNVTVLAVIPCPCCGRNNTLRMNSSNRAYFTCKWPTGDDGTICNEHHRYSRKRTDFHVKTYRQNELKMKGPEYATEEDTGTPAKRTGGVYDFYD